MSGVGLLSGKALQPTWLPCPSSPRSRSSTRVKVRVIRNRNRTRGGRGKERERDSVSENFAAACCASERSGLSVETGGCLDGVRTHSICPGRLPPFSAFSRQRKRRQGGSVRVNATLIDLTAQLGDNAVLQSFSSSLNLFAEILLKLLPWPLNVVGSTLALDLSTVLTGDVTSQAVTHALAVYYILFASPKPIIGILDYYIVGPIDNFIRNSGLDQRGFRLRGTLGGGNFGTIYDAIRLKSGEDEADIRDLTEKEVSKRRVVMKRIKTDNLGVRKNFLTSGTMAQGTEETGIAEAFMFQRIKRNPLAAKYCANFLGDFVADEFGSGFDKNSQWLVFKYESEMTLSDCIDGRIGSYPECLEDFKNRRDESGMIKLIIKEILEGLANLHVMGIVHRDIKPDNILLTKRGNARLIDFGAAVDLCTGVNFNPKTGFLDPRYCPPEEFVMPQKTPRAPLPILASLFSPLLWISLRPGVFDVYAVGIIFLQMTVPQMRKNNFFRTFQREIKKFEYDLDDWRKSPASSAKQCDFSLLDKKLGSGWDLACKMVSLKSKRITPSAALRHPYFLLA